MEQQQGKNVILVTGAAGFLGRYVIGRLLMQQQDNLIFSHSLSDNSRDKGSWRDTVGVCYDQIIAMDMSSADDIGNFFHFSPRVLPLQMNMESLLNKNSLEHESTLSLLKSVSSVIHLAGVVDTREHTDIQCKLDRINIQCTAALVDMAEAAGVSRFVHISSASACIQSKKWSMYNFTFRSFCSVLLGKSMLSFQQMSTYGRTKRAGEQYVISKHSSAMLVTVVRPHVVWGRGDTLSTETLISWDRNVPDISIGDPKTKVVSGRVDVVAAYILMADMMLHRGKRENSGLTFDVGDKICSLGDLHSQIANCRLVKDKPCSAIINTSHQCHYCSSKKHLPANTSHIFVIPACIVVLLIMILEWVQLFVKLWNLESMTSGCQNIFKLLTANNFAYASNSLSDCPMLLTFDKDCLSLFARSYGYELNNKNTEVEFNSWKLKLPCNHVILSKDWLIENITRLSDDCNDVLMGSTLLSSPTSIGPIKLNNRVIKAATFECMGDEDGVPTDELQRFHVRMVNGGVAMTVIAYASVSADGRSFPTQICLNSDNKEVNLRTEEALTSLCTAVHTARAGALVALQLTHAGAFADANHNHGKPAVGPSAILNPLTMTYSLSLDGDSKNLQRIENDFIQAVEFCRRCGFDAVEIHLGHGYLLSQFLSAATNGKYAKDAAARLKFPLQVLKKVCDCAHNGGRYIAVMVKHNVSELNEQDLSMSDARLFARSFVDAKADMLVPSGGHVMVNGLHMIRGGRPLAEMAEAQQNWLKKMVLEYLGEYFVKKETFREGFFRERVISVMLGAGVDLGKVCLVGGIHEFKTADAAVRVDGFLCVQLGRVLVADPDWCLKMGVCKKAEHEQATDMTTSRKKKVKSRDRSKVQKDSGQIPPVGAQAVNICDNSNACIVGATMALKPLKCTKYSVEW